VNFKGIWAAFGDIAGGGCPGCYQNVVNFWCGYTCSPRQADFVSFLGTPDKVDPVSGATYTVGESAATLDTGYACDMFETCANTGKVKEFSPLQTCEGFMKYQGETEAIQTGLSFIIFNFSGSSSSGSGSGNASAANASSSLSWPLYSCCNFPASITTDSPLPWPPSPRDGPNMSCPCASCGGMCSGGQCLGGGGGAYAGLGESPDDPLLGFNTAINFLGLQTSIIGVFASCVMAVSVPLVLWRALLVEDEGEGAHKEPLLQGALAST
jgi:hypothetical protein